MMAFNGEYKCTKCNKVHKRDDLVVKRAVFQEMGARPTVFRSRVVAWLCPQCLAQDSDWQKDSYTGPSTGEA